MKKKLENALEIAVVTVFVGTYAPGAVMAPAHDIHCTVITAPYAVKDGACDRIPKRDHEEIESTVGTTLSSLTSSIALPDWR